MKSTLAGLEKRKQGFEAGLGFINNTSVNRNIEKLKGEEHFRSCGKGEFEIFTLLKLR